MRRPDMAYVNALALDHENLPRALAAMGFDLRVNAFPRGGIKWWQPAYLRLPPRDALRYPPAVVEGFLASRRAALAPINRGLRDTPVYLMHRSEPEAFICVDAMQGEWRSPDNAVRGDDLVSLASYMWGVGLAYAAHRLARACGLAEAPLIHG